MSGGGGAHRTEQFAHNALERIREKDEEIAGLKRQLDATARDLKRVTDHSKLQSQELFKLKEENRALQETISRLGTAFEKEKEELLTLAQISKTEAQVYKEDFIRERQDRERAAGKLESLERYHKDHKAHEEEMKRLQKELSKAKEEAQAKVSQVKQYKKQLDAQEAKIGKLDKERHEQSLLIATLKKDCNKLQQLVEKSQKKEEKELKGKEIKAGKKKREASIKEGREKRKQTMAPMDMKGRATFLDKELADLEEANHCLKTQLESSDATCVLLAEKLNQAEARLKVLEKQNDDLWSHQEIKIHVPVEETRPMFNPFGKKEHAATEYMNVKHRKASEESDYMYIDGSQPHAVEGKQERHNQTLVPPGAATKHPHVPHTAPQPRDPPTYDPAFLSKTHDYVNLLPEECLSIAKATRTPKDPKKPHATPRSKVPQHRAASMDTDRVTSRRKSSSDYASLPDILQSTEGGEGDISKRIDMEIHDEATEVATLTARDERRNTLKHVPFDPFLKCLYCNRMFRYGEIQKYKRHVLTCTESSS